MKKICILLTLVIVTKVATFAQMGPTPPVQEKRNLEKELKAIEATVDPTNPKSAKAMAKAATWIKRGDIFHAIYKDKSAAKLSADPLTEALISYKKALEVDTKGRSGQTIKSRLLLLTTDIYNQAIEAYNKEDFVKGMRSFEQYLEINQLPIVAKDNPNFVDTATMFNAGLCAYKSKNYDKAIKYFSEGVKYGYNIGSSADLLKNAYMEKKDSASALKVLQDAFARFPENNDVIVSLTNFYIKANKTDEAIKYLKLAIEKEPTNPSFYCALGNLYEKMQNKNDSIENGKLKNPSDKSNLKTGISIDAVIKMLNDFNPNGTIQYRNLVVANLGNGLSFSINDSKNSAGVRYLANGKTMEFEFDSQLKLVKWNIEGGALTGNVTKTDYQNEAINSYLKAIEVDNKYHDAYYYLGYYYIVLGDKHNEIARNVPANDTKTYNAEIESAINWYEKATVMMEKCRELKPDNTNAIEFLKNLYYRLNKMDKYEEMKKLLEK